MLAKGAGIRGKLPGAGADGDAISRSRSVHRRSFYSLTRDGENAIWRSRLQGARTFAPVSIAASPARATIRKLSATMKPRERGGGAHGGLGASPRTGGDRRFMEREPKDG